MKTAVIFTLLTIAALANPAWYNKLSAKPYEAIGYGADTSPEEARRFAIKDIGDQIAVVEVSEIKVKGTVMKNAERVLNRETSAELTGAEIIRLERQGQGYFAAARLDRRPIEIRFLEKIKTPKRRANDDGFIFRSPFAKALNKAAGYTVDFSIVQEGDRYAIGDENRSIAWNQPDLTQLFDISQNLALKLSLNANGEAAIVSDESGYLKLIYMNEFGEYALKKTRIDANQTIRVEARATVSDRGSRGFLIAVFSLSPFAPLAANEAKLGFAELARFLDRHIYSAVETTSVRLD
ncbi:MAG: hypothetical protein LBF86_05045 [Helicobacteraceae bacterium]|jgi:hypothetical protein|nr:hypothetical protein [Helicobacteraceae bacterium]